MCRLERWSHAVACMGAGIFEVLYGEYNTHRAHSAVMIRLIKRKKMES